MAATRSTPRKTLATTSGRRIARAGGASVKLRRTQAARRIEAERRMLDAAIALIARKGLPALSLANVGVRAGYSRALPTHYFGTRSRLISALTESVVRDYVSRVQAHGRSGSSLTDLLGAIDYYLTDVLDDPMAWRAFFAIANAALTDADAAAALSQVNARAIGAFEAYIRAGIAAGEMRADIDPHAEAALILASLRGLASLLLSDAKNASVIRARSLLAKSVQRNLASAATGKQAR